MNKLLKNAILGVVAAASIGVSAHLIGKSIIEHKANEPAAIEDIRRAMVKEVDIEIERKIELGLWQKLFVNVTGSKDEASREADARTRARIWLRDNKERLQVEVEHMDIASYSKNPFSPATYRFKIVDRDNREPIAMFRLDENRNPVSIEVMERSAFMRQLASAVEQAAR